MASTLPVAVLPGSDRVERGERRWTLDDVFEGVTERYTNGDCAELAYAIHQITGWPMYATVEWVEPSVGGEHDYGWTHAFVQTPDGRFLDIMGLWDAQDLLLHWDWAFDRHAIEAGIDVFPERDIDDICPADIETRCWANVLVGLVR